jgi:U32 family peptidase
MRLISPIDNVSEAEPLLKAGADELYGGYVPKQWLERFGLLASINQRTFAGAQLDTLADLQRVVDCCQKQGRDFALTLNSPFYSDQQQSLLLDYVVEAVSAGVSSIILADLGLLRLLKREFPQLLYHASTLAHLGNSAAICFYKHQGIGRVVLPRHLNVAEMNEIARNVDDVACDAFLLVGKCPNTEGYCSFHHSSDDKIWPCEIEYCIETVGSESDQLQQAISKQQSWSQSDRRHGCGLCAIPALLDSGIKGLKLVGRGAPLLRKIKNLQLVSEFLSLAQTNLSFPDYQKRALAAHRQHFGIGCCENVCYYPEFYA